MKILIVILWLRFSNKAAKRLFVKLSIWIKGLHNNRLIGHWVPMVLAVLKWVGRIGRGLPG